MGELIQGETFAMYQARTGINATAIKRGRMSPKHMRHALTCKEPPATDSMIWGKLVHEAVLIGVDNFAVYPGPVRRGKAFDEFSASNEGKDIVLKDQLIALHNIRESVMSNTKAREIIENTDHEVTCLWPSEWGSARARFDAISPRFLADLKTTAKFHPREFESQAYNLGYHIQMAWYLSGANDCGYEPAVYVIAIESDAPYDVVCYLCDEELIERGMDEAKATLDAYQDAQKAGKFPGVAEDVRVLALPTWAAEKQTLIIGGATVVI
mgnify:CR=1 FL=1